MKSNIFNEQSGAGDFGQVYMILVFAIAALLLILIVKPMFSQAQKAIPKATGS